MVRARGGLSGGQSRRRMLLPPLAIALAVVVASWLGLAGTIVPEAARDADLCPVDTNRIGGDAVFLLDLTKPTVGMSATMPGRKFHDLTLELERNTEIRVYLLAGSANAPLALIERLCKPFGTADVQVAEAKDHDGTVRDCDDLPAQMPSDLRRAAGRFCELRDDLVKRMDSLVANASQQSWVVTDAYLTDAIDRIRFAFQERLGPHRLHVVSDMLQHADWYSHLDLDWSRWDFDDFTRRAASRNRLFALGRDRPAIEVDVHYLVRDGMTTGTEAAGRHRQFWQAYFGGANLSFHDQPSIPAYESVPVMDLTPDSGLAASGATAAG